MDINSLFNSIQYSKDGKSVSLINEMPCLNEEELSYYAKQCEVHEDETMLYSIYKPEAIVEGEDGLIYSKDGSRLFSCGKNKSGVFRIKEGTQFVCSRAFDDGGLVILHSPFSPQEETIKIILPESLLYIPRTAIPDNCQIVSYSPYYVVIDDLLIDVRGGIVIKCLNHHAKKIVIADKVKKIGERAFMDHAELEEVVFPDSLISIEENAFEGCSGLEKVLFPSSLEKIEREVFWRCNNIRVNYLPVNLKKIGDYALYNCILDNAVIPKSIEEIGVCPFSRCNSDVKSASSVYTIIDGFLINSISKELIQLLYDKEKVIEIPKEVTEIGSRAFMGTKINSITIPDNVVIMRDKCFGMCNNLREIKLECKIKVIPYGSFFSCKSLKEIEIPESVEEIQDHAFSSCNSLSKITFNNGLKSIGRQAFYYCKGLSSISFPDSLTEIGFEAFDQCTTLSSIQLNNGLRIIKDDAFKDCNINYLYIPESVEYFGSCKDMVGYTKNQQSMIYYDAKRSTTKALPSVSNIVIGDNVEVLPEHFIEGKSYFLEKITIPKNVKLVKKDCITNCTTSWLTIKIESKDIEFEKGWLHNCSSLRRIYVPASIYDKVYSSLKAPERDLIKKVHFYTIFRG